MGRDSFYFTNLQECVECAKDASVYLLKTLERFEQQTMRENVRKIHEIESVADRKRHELLLELDKAFITPIEREDLECISSYIDDIVDGIEDIGQQIYIRNISRVRKDVLKMIEHLVVCIEWLQKAVKELVRFRGTNRIKEYVVRVNDLEEEGKSCYIEAMLQLYKERDTVTIVVWDKIYEYIEECFDCCEKAANQLEIVVLKNS